MEKDNKNPKAEESKEVKEKAQAELTHVEKVNDFGKIKLTDTVIVDVIKKAAVKVDGVTRLAGSSFIDNIANIISSQRSHDRAIGLRIKKDLSLEIEIKINVRYGENIPNIASIVQNTIRDEVKNILGLKVSLVNIIIQEVEYSPDKNSSEKKD